MHDGCQVMAIAHMAFWLIITVPHCVILNSMVGRGICEKYQLTDSQIPSQDWYFSQIPCPTVIYLFNYTEYTFATGTGDVIKIWRKGSREGKKGESKNANIPLQRVKMANSPWLLDNHEICFKYTCNGPIKTRYFYIRCIFII